jgi:hypothetical protein
MITRMKFSSRNRYKYLFGLSPYSILSFSDSKIKNCLWLLSGASLYRIPCYTILQYPEIWFKSCVLSLNVFPDMEVYQVVHVIMQLAILLPLPLTVFGSKNEPRYSIKPTSDALMNKIVDAYNRDEPR